MYFKQHLFGNAYFWTYMTKFVKDHLNWVNARGWKCSHLLILVCMNKQNVLTFK